MRLNTMNASTMPQTLTIGKTFHGPPASGNGGYVCGRLARFIDGPALVRLKAPPPLGRPLTVEDNDTGVQLTDQGRIVALARPTAFDLEVPSPPTPDEALRASRSYRGFTNHWFPTCFVCGPARDEGQGLRIFAGPLPDRDMVAAPWKPHSTLADHNGMVRSEFVWAALDCPGAFTFPEPEKGVALLGEMAARLTTAVRAAEPCVVVGWSLGRKGRLHFSATALFDRRGTCCAMARATWVEVDAMPA